MARTREFFLAARIQAPVAQSCGEPSGCCFLPWFSDKTEWNGTDVIFDITPTAAGCSVAMMHRGLTPDVECYGMCQPGWEGHIMKSLPQLITTGVGTPK